MEKQRNLQIDKRSNKNNDNININNYIADTICAQPDG
jgi:hypothetical protein